MFRIPLMSALPLLLLPTLLAAQASPLSRLPDVPFTRFTLVNGLDVVLAPDTSATEVAVEWWVHAGTRDEPVGLFGLAHLFEHATPYGAGVASLASGRVLMDSLRTNSNAVTRPDYTSYFRQILPDGLDLFLLEAADRISADPALDFTPSMVDRHRTNVAAEIARNSNGLWSQVLGSAMGEGTFGAAHPYGHDAYGTSAETARVRPDDLIKWFRAHIRPEYITLLVVGRFDPDGARWQIERYFGSIPGGTRPPPQRPIPAIATRLRGDVSIPDTVHRLVLSWPAPEWGAPAHPLLAIASRIIDARLQAQLPPDVTAEIEYDSWQLAGRFGIVLTFGDTSRSAELERWARRVIASVGTMSITPQELAAAQDRLIADLEGQVSRLGFLGSRAELLGQSMMFANDPGAWRSIAARQLEASPGEISQAVSRWFGSPGFVLDVTGTAER